MSNGYLNDSFRAAESIGANLVVAVNATGENQCQLADTSTSMPLGVIQDAVSTNGAANVVIFGVTRAQAGASVSSGAQLTWQTATGKVIEVTNNTTTAIDRVIGIAIQSGSTNSTIKILVNPSYFDNA